MDEVLGNLDENMKSWLTSSPRDLQHEHLEAARECLLKLSTTRIFTSYASNPDWLVWASEQQKLNALFRPPYKMSAIDEELATWFAENYAIRHPDTALSVFNNHGGQLNPELWWRIAWQLSHGKEDRDPEVMHAWVAVLLDTVPNIAKGKHSIDFLLLSCRVPDDYRSAFLLFAHLITPTVHVRPTMGALFGKGQPKRLVESEVVLRGEEYWITEAWGKLFKTQLEEYWQDLEPLLRGNLELAHSIYVGNKDADEKRDPANFRRSAIEPHQQDQARSDLDPLIDAARDTLEHIVGREREVGRVLIDLWFYSRAPLVRRIAIHCMRLADGIPADHKLDWLLDHDLLFAVYCHHEVFQFLQVIYPSASDDLRRQVIERVEDGPPIGEGEESARHGRYRVYNILQWISGNAPECAHAQEALERAQERDPDFKSRDNADFTFYVDSMELIENQSPVSESELESASDEDFLEILKSRLPEEKHGTEPDRRGLVKIIETVAKKNPDWAISRARILGQNNMWMIDVWDALLDAWGSQRLEARQWKRILELLRESGELHVKSWGLAGLLERGVRQADGGMPTELIPIADEIAEKLWTNWKSRDPGPEWDKTDWLGEAINYVPGEVVEFWIQSLYRMLSSQDEKPEYLPEEWRRRFDDIVEGTDIGSQLGRVLLASRMHYFERIDRDWTHEKLLPLLDWNEDKDRAQQAWDGFLVWGQFTPTLIPHFERFAADTAKHLEPGQQDRRQRFLEMVAAVLFYDPEFHGRAEWLDQMYRELNESECATFVRGIHSQLWNMPDDQKTKAWERWLKTLWEQRSLNQPVPMSVSEGTTWVGMVSKLEPVFDEAVAMVCGVEALDLNQISLFWDLDRRDLAEREPDTVAKLLTCLTRARADEPAQVVHCSELWGLYGDLKRKLEVAELEDLYENLLRLCGPQP